MKKIVLAAFAASAVLGSAPAFAAPAAAGSLTYNLDASVGSVCGAYRSGGTTVAVPFGDLAATSSSTSVPVNAGSATFRCNSPVGFTRTITSTNGGKLVRTGGNGDASNSIAFTMSEGGGNSASFGPASLATPKVDNFGASPAFLAGQTGSINFQINGVGNINTSANDAPGTTVFAGTYTDTVTIAVTAL